MAKSGKFWRKHNSAALVIGKDEAQQFHEHYKQHGIHVDFKETECGDLTVKCNSREDYLKMLKARGLVDRG